MLKVFLIAGARPNFMKIAPIYRAALKHSQVECRIVHTGQHYDYDMSEAFFEDLELPKPDFFLNAGSGTHAVQTAKIMVGFEELCQKEKPDLIIVVGDVNSTLACSVVAKKLGVDVAHVEAGLRSFDLTMPEEINRMVTDAISDYFFVTEESGTDNLIREGKSEDRIHFAGNVMIDNLFYQAGKLDGDVPGRFPASEIKEKLEDYAFLTLHRPSNVDTRPVFCEIAEALNAIANRMPILFPVHPRTVSMIELFSIKIDKKIRLIEPVGYLDFIALQHHAAKIITDSGGVQKEAYLLGKPCITLRPETEWVETVEADWNLLLNPSTPDLAEKIVAFAPTGKAPAIFGQNVAEKMAKKIILLLGS